MIDSCWRCGTLTTVVNGRCIKCNLDLTKGGERITHQCDQCGEDCDCGNDVDAGEYCQLCDVCDADNQRGDE